MHLKMPLKVDEDDDPYPLKPRERGIVSALIRKLFRFKNNQNILPKTRTSYLTAPFIRARAENFAIHSTEHFFSPSQRSMIVWYILNRTPYKGKKKDAIGIKKLLNVGVYKASFPLHDGDINSSHLSTRALLHQNWGSMSSWYRTQPLGLVKDYFGDKIGLYFAWLGTYTKALFLPAIVGLVCFLYGICSVNTDANIVSKEICNYSLAGNLTMCPICNGVCPYWKLGDSCFYSKVSYLFDNYATFFFSIFMSIWAITFLETWKRRQAQLSWEWDLIESGYVDEEEIRPEYESRAREYRLSPVTKKPEPYIPQSKRAIQYIISGFGISFLCCCLLVAMLLIIMYRLVIVTQLSKVENQTVKRYAKFFASSTAALINVLMITAFKPIGRKLAHILTEYEAPRTQSDFENNYTFKVFAFDFVNVYSSLIYIAIFKGRFYMHPGDKEATASNFNIIRTDACDPSGCFFELCIQMAFIMIGRQIANNVLEIVIPKVRIWWKNRNRHQAEKKRNFNDRLSRWEADYNLQEVDMNSLYEEYNEMVIQFGLITLFVASFPLAPFFALLNNIIEIRLDAFKIVTQFRRPVAQRVSDIGVWMEILKALTYLAAVTNAFIIAFSSEFVPRLVHLYTNNFNFSGYLNFTLSSFNTSRYENEMGPNPEVDDTNVTLCYYRAMRNPSNHDFPYQLSINYWYTLVARLAFVVSFEHVVLAVCGILAYIIPDLPSSVKEKMARERLLEREALASHEIEPESAVSRVIS